MDNPTVSCRNEWENRAQLLGANLNSVLFKNMPEVLNQHFDAWHKNIIRTTIGDVNQQTKVLDVGCGYGRLSSDLLNKFPNLDITGIDISETYLKIFQETLKRKAVLGNAETFSPELGHFDYILCVTVLMYVPEERQQLAFENLWAHLKQGGRLIIIEPDRSGAPFLSGFGVISLFKKYFRKNKIDTGGYFIKGSWIKDIVAQKGGRVITEHRIPATTFFILLMYLIGKFFPKKLTQACFRIISHLDNSLNKFKLPSVHVAYIVTNAP